MNKFQMALSNTIKRLFKSQILSLSSYCLQSTTNGQAHSTHKQQTVKNILIKWTKTFDEMDIPESKLSAEYILSHVLHLSRNELYKAHNKVLSDELAEINRLMTCRLARMPVQYILGEWDFHNLTLMMRPPVFIPRPETEQLVNIVIDRLQQEEYCRSLQVLEIGCGSGAICLSILKDMPNVECTAIDQSKHAVLLTQENANRLGLHQRLNIIQGKVSNENFPEIPHAQYDLIVANPPYVLRKDLMNCLPEIKIFEDLRALDGGKEGLDIIKPLLVHCQHLLPIRKSILLEVDPCHPYLIPQWMEQKGNSLKLKLINVIKDFAGKDRFLEFIKF